MSLASTLAPPLSSSLSVSSRESTGQKNWIDSIHAHLFSNAEYLYKFASASIAGPPHVAVNKRRIVQICRYFRFFFLYLCTWQVRYGRYHNTTGIHCYGAEYILIQFSIIIHISMYLSIFNLTFLYLYVYICMYVLTFFHIFWSSLLKSQL